MFRQPVLLLDEDGNVRHLRSLKMMANSTIFPQVVREFESQREAATVLKVSLIK